LVHQLRPKHILEFGSGVSTKLLLRAAQDLGTCFVSSVDHDPDFIANFPMQGGSQRQACLSVQLAPLVSRKFGEQFLPVYRLDSSKFAISDPVDLCIVDGPPASLGGRPGTLYQLMEYCRPGTCLLLDDANRPDEKNALAGWASVLGDAIEIRTIEGFAKGLGAVIIREIVKPGEIWDHMMKRAVRDLNSAVSSGSRALTNFVVEREFSFPPASGDDVINAIRRHVLHGVDVVVFGWPAFWWFEHFKELAPFLHSQARTVVKNDRIAVYEFGPLSNVP
jgi:hypothetical protein